MSVLTEALDRIFDWKLQQNQFYLTNLQKGRTVGAEYYSAPTLIIQPLHLTIYVDPLIKTLRDNNKEVREMARSEFRSTDCQIPRN